ncbi:ribonuclease H-like domain-containing protein [Nitrosomonas supralitoralis]|uniref:YprB ribonuclease H-like domain-containing protein n=1 Tax=Nitrosomonas supralitoralis TaxID=2116706 RepID=A0A2P7NXG7_9PROT|nr:ribonuclease H-like domain-containing protein [Nitrosomonas supralitoralis]PSJ18149.1 hypothetical protein C7H79_04680 [Nitrosomonas supralitoralis]
MSEKILVVDVGESIIGIQPVKFGRYIPYYGDKRVRALERLEDAGEVVTYNGNEYDIRELNKLSIRLRNTDFIMRGIHTDMRELCWPNIWGSNLRDTYKRYCSIKTEFPDTYEGSNRSDVFRTLHLWRYWKKHKEFRW